MTIAIVLLFAVAAACAVILWAILRVVGREG